MENGVTITKELWHDDNLSLIEKVVLSDLKRFGDVEIKLNNLEMAERYKVTRGRCSQIIISLEKKGYLQTSYDKVNRRTIKINGETTITLEDIRNYKKINVFEKEFESE